MCPARLIAPTLSRDVHGQVPWPVNVVINGHAQQYYKVAFRHLWASKLVERRLCTAWRTLQCMRPFRW